MPAAAESQQPKLSEEVRYVLLFHQYSIHAERAWLIELSSLRVSTNQPEERTKIQVWPPFVLLSAQGVFYNKELIGPYSVPTRGENG